MWKFRNFTAPSCLILSPSQQKRIVWPWIDGAWRSLSRKVWRYMTSHQQRWACKNPQICNCSTKEREPAVSKRACNTIGLTRWPSWMGSEVDLRVTTVMMTCPCFMLLCKRTYSLGTTHPVSSSAALVSFFIWVAQQFLDTARDTINTFSVSSVGQVLNKVALINI